MPSCTGIFTMAIFKQAGVGHEASCLLPALDCLLRNCYQQWSVWQPGCRPFTLSSQTGLFACKHAQARYGTSVHACPRALARLFAHACVNRHARMTAWIHSPWRPPLVACLTPRDAVTLSSQQHCGNSWMSQ